MCRSAAAHFVFAASTTVQDNAFLNLLESGNAWSKQVYFGDSQILMKIDTGADVIAIPEQLYQQRLGQRYALQISDLILHGPDGNQFPVSGCIKVPLLCTVPDALLPNHAVYVVRGLQAPLLGRPAIQGLRILGQVNHISERTIDIKNAKTSFRSLFSGLGKIQRSPS